MQGDFSRLTYQQRKHFALVLRQQGRVDVDADWNEQQAILRHFLESEGIDVIGHSGVPQGPEGGFAIGLSADAKDLTISKGRMYVEGILCENDDDGVTVLTQPDLPAGEGAAIAGVAIPPPSGTYVAYLDVWLRHISAVDDSSIREKALGGPDTASRARVVWQVKLQKVAAGADCGAFVPPAATTGKLAAQTAVVDAGDGPCVLPPTAGYRRLQNQLYRVEVHNPGPLASATFKWSRENGSVVTSVLGGGQTLTVHDTGRDDNLGFRDDDWVELLDERSDLTDHRGTLLQIAQSPNADDGITIKPATPVPKIDLTLHPRLRRWDQRAEPGGPDISNGVPMASTAPGGWISLEDGLQVSFAAGDYRSGDYWLIPARTAVDAETGNIEWPVSDVAPHTPLSLPHMGVIHSYAPLAVVDSNGTTLKVRSDCRPKFPPLTNLPAGDCCCAVSLSPDEDWQTKLEKLLDQGKQDRPLDASVCFKVGLFTVTRKLSFAGRGSVKITGSGPGTKIVADRFETALEFARFESVTVSDLSAESGRTGISGDGMKNLGGVLSFRNCRNVDVHRVWLLGADGIRKAGSCLMVENDPSRPASVRVHHCDLAVGRYQVGILVSNTERVQIEDNRLAASTSGPPVAFSRLMENERLRGEYRRLLVAEMPITPERVRRSPPIASNHVPVTVTSGQDQKETFSFFTPKDLAPHWQELIDANANSNLRRRTKSLREFVHALARRLLSDPAFRNAPSRDRTRPWANFFNTALARPFESEPRAAAQGIVVGGQVAGDVRIRDNTVQGVSQGIHVGLSHRGAKQGDPASSDSAPNVLIEGNSVDVLLPLAVRGREGIFVGNGDNILIRANRLTVAPAAVARELGVDGICIYGYLGKLMIVRENRLRSFPGGIYIHPLRPSQKLEGNHRPLWLVAENMIENASVRIDPPAVPDVIARDNYTF